MTSALPLKTPSWDSAKWEPLTEDTVADVLAHKKKGNELCATAETRGRKRDRRADLLLAIASYDAGLSRLAALRGLNKEDAAEASVMAVPLLLNKAAAWLVAISRRWREGRSTDAMDFARSRMQKHTKCSETCTVALQHDPESVKALYRRANACGRRWRVA